MKPILARAERAVLEQFAWSRVLLAFDFDGTLAPIVDEPHLARMRRSTRARLVEVALRYPCSVLSGRARADVARRLEGVPLVEVVGNHGVESTRAMGRAATFTRVTHRWTQSLRESLADAPGVEIENKGPSLAIHYRKSRRRRDARLRIERSVAALEGARRVIPGKLVVNVLPEGAPHKGIALRKIRADIGADTAIYVGDDVTDEDVFALDEPGRLLSIRVGRDARSAAPYYLRSQAAIDDLLDRLISYRERVPPTALRPTRSRHG